MLGYRTDRKQVRLIKSVLAVFAVCYIYLVSVQDSAAQTVMWVVDDSASMAVALNGESRIKAAVSALQDVIRSLPSDINQGLTVYGHTIEECAAFDVLLPAMPQLNDALIEELGRLGPSNGIRPLADALRAAATAIESLPPPKWIVLVTAALQDDCHGDPFEAVDQIKKEQPDVAFHVVGVGLEDEEQTKVLDLVQKTGAVYHNVNDINALAEIFRDLKKEIGVVKTTVLVEDEFTQPNLANHWTVYNEDPDSYLIEDGALKILAALPPNELLEPHNLILLNHELPDQWEAIVRVRYTSYDDFGEWLRRPLAGIILYKDKDNGYLFVVGQNGGYGSNAVHEAVYFQKVKDRTWVPGFSVSLNKHKPAHEVVLRLTRRDRRLTGYFLDDSGAWRKVGEFIDLKPSYQIGLAAFLGDGRAHEALQEFESFTLKEWR